MSYNYLPLDRKWLNFQQVKNLLDYEQLVSITFDAHERILKCRAFFDNLDNRSPHYDINTGFSSKDDIIPGTRVDQLQYQLLKSQARGLGEEVPLDIVKLMLMLKIKSLSYGSSGVQIDTVKRLMDLYNNAVFPAVYTQGGNVAALSHLSLPLIGSGKVYFRGEKIQCAEVLNALGWKPITLRSKEALALTSGTQVITAYGMYTLKKAEQLFTMADAIAAMSSEAFYCGAESFHEKIQSIRTHKGEVETTETIRGYLRGSKILSPGKQDIHCPYPFRSIPQIHGAAKDTFEYVLAVFLKEINSVSGDPVIFPEDGLILTAGNTDGFPLITALDFLCNAVSGLGGISARRVSHLLSGERELPLNLVKSAELHYGLGALPTTAADIVYENTTLCTSASSANGNTNDIENSGVSAIGAIKCLKVVENVEKILAIELLSATQALEMRRPAQSSPFIERFFAAFKDKVTFVDEDRMLNEDILRSVAFISEYKF